MIMLALLTKFLAREAELVVISAKGQALETVPRGTGRLLVFPGSFDPLHEGHTKLAEAALDATKRRDAEEPSLLYEISLKNADKGVIDVEQAEERVLQFKKENAAVALTRRALYVDKSQLFGPCDFVMGADTASRVLDAKYYGGVEGLAEAPWTRCAKGAAGLWWRAGSESRGVDAHEALASAPDSHRDMFLEIPDFRVDVAVDGAAGARRAQGRVGFGCLGRVLCAVCASSMAAAAAAASEGLWEDAPAARRGGAAAQSPGRAKGAGGVLRVAAELWEWIAGLSRGSRDPRPRGGDSPGSTKAAAADALEVSLTLRGPPLDT